MFKTWGTTYVGANHFHEWISFPFSRNTAQEGFEQGKVLYAQRAGMVNLFDLRKTLYTPMAHTSIS